MPGQESCKTKEKSGVSRAVGGTLRIMQCRGKSRLPVFYII